MKFLKNLEGPKRYLSVNVHPSRWYLLPYFSVWSSKDEQFNTFDFDFLCFGLSLGTNDFTKNWDSVVAPAPKVGSTDA